MDTLRRHPALTSVAFFVIAVAAVIFVSPSGDLALPTVGGAVALFAAIALFLALRRQSLPSRREEIGGRR